MRSAVMPPQSAHCVRSQLPQGDANPLSHRCAMPAPPKGELFEVAGKFLVALDTLALKATACTLSVKAYGFARFPLLSLRDIFPRPGEVFPQRESQEHYRKLSRYT